MSVSGPRILVLHALTAALFATFGWASGRAAHAQDAVPAVEPPIVLATTTSVRDSGLLDALLPLFLESQGIEVRIVAVGTGAALRMGREGNADVLITHAPEAEEELVAAGFATSREPFMENHFVIVGPPEDPVGVREATSPAEAYRRIEEAGAAYVSRGDDSGTHKREVALLGAAGLNPHGGWEGFARTGSGMGITLQVAGERRAYTISDVGTFLAFRERIGLEVLSQTSDDLRNVYSVLRVNPERFPGRIRAEGAQAFERFLLDPETQGRILTFGSERFGRPLFRPTRLGRQRPASG